jgi:hypothetical protein
MHRAAAAAAGAKVAEEKAVGVEVEARVFME